MKVVVFAIIGAIAATMAYLAWRGECRGGEVVVDEAACRQHFDVRACALAFKAADVKALENYAPFQSQDDCLRTFNRCQPHRAVPSGYVPVPRAICVARVNGIVDGTPLYERIGKSLSQN